MVHFVGAGPGALDLITLRGAALLEKADQVRAKPRYGSTLGTRVSMVRSANRWIGWMRWGSDMM